MAKKLQNFREIQWDVTTFCKKMFYILTTGTQLEYKMQPFLREGFWIYFHAWTTGAGDWRKTPGKNTLPLLESRNVGTKYHSIFFKGFYKPSHRVWIAAWWVKKKKLIRKKSPQSFGIFKSNSITLHEQHTSLCHIVIFIQSIFHSKVLLKDLSELSSCQYLSSFNSETARHRISYYFLLEFLLW